MKFLRKAMWATNRLLRPLGLEVRRRRSSVTEVHDPSQTHFFEAMSLFRPTVIQIEVERTRWKGGRISFGESHPFVAAIRSGADRSDPETAVRATLKGFYRDVLPRDCSDIVEQFIGSRCTAFSVSSHHPQWPWKHAMPESHGEVSPVYVDGKIRLSPAQEVGIQHWGPVSPEKLETEVRKLTLLLQSIRRHGYVPSTEKADGHICGYVLRKDTEWVVVIEQGQHRAGVLSALDFSTIPVRVDGVIDYADASHFPNVASGLYSVEEAHDQFERMLKGVPIPALANWLDKRA